MLLPILIVTLVIRGALVRNKVRVQWRQASVLCAAVIFSFVFIGALADGEIWACIIIAVASPLVRAAFGAVFRLGAFGFRREMVMGTQMPED